MPQQKSKFKRGFKTWAEKQGIEYRESLGLQKSSPLCAFKLAKFLDIPIFEPNDIEGLPVEQLEHLTNEGSSFWSAATIPVSDDVYIIVHNPKHSVSRQQSNLMHEISHILCEHKVEENSIVSSLSGFLRNHNEEQELEAEWLGACLQLPKDSLLWALYKGMAVPDISEHFNASEQMVKYRLRVSGASIQYSRTKRRY